MVPRELKDLLIFICPFLHFVRPSVANCMWKYPIFYVWTLMTCKASKWSSPLFFLIPGSSSHVQPCHNESLRSVIACGPSGKGSVWLTGHLAKLRYKKADLIKPEFNMGQVLCTTDLPIYPTFLLSKFNS